MSVKPRYLYVHVVVSYTKMTCGVEEMGYPSTTFASENECPAIKLLCGYQISKSTHWQGRPPTEMKAKAVRSEVLMQQTE